MTCIQEADDDEEMEPNSGSATDNVCSIHTTRKPCERAKAQKCDWDRTALTCIQEADGDEEMEPNSGSALGPATTTTTTTTTTPETTTTTTTSTSTTTTTSNPGDMELNSGSLGSPSGAPTSVCSLHTKKRACEGAKAQKCDWDRTAMTCIQEADDEEMEPNSESATSDLQGCASLYKRKAKCQKNAACTWTRAKSIKDRCTPVAT